MLPSLCIGHKLFWLLRGEMYIPLIRERHAVLLVIILTHLGPYRDTLLREIYINDYLKRIARGMWLVRIVCIVY